MGADKNNPAASIHRRLLNGAKGRGEDFQLTLVRYGSERLLYRLARSSFADRFVLKGALLLLLWDDDLHRPTRDIDLEGFGTTDPDNLARVFRTVCTQTFPEDALQFDTDSVHANEIRTAQEYGGVRVTMTCHLGKARIPLQIDIGFGDAITPAPSVRSFPTLLDLPAPELRTYPLETVVAEKFEAMVRLGLGNSRMKDFRDLHSLARRQDFDGALLAKAVRATFANRQARVEDVGEVLTNEFFTDSTLETRWRAYRRSQPRADDLPESLAEVGTAILPRTAVQAPDMNAFAERWVLSVKRECLSKLILFGEGHLRRTLSSYVEHYNSERPHQGLGNRLVTPRDAKPPNEGEVVADERLGGLLRSYRRVA